MKSSSNQRSGPEQRRVHDAGTSSMCKECWDVQFPTIIMLFAHAILGCDTTSRVFRMRKGLALKHIRSDKHFITQAEVFLHENATLADISSAGEAALVCPYTGAVGETLYKLRLLRFHQKVSTSTRFVQPENLLRHHQLPRTIASVCTFRCKYGMGNQGLVHICNHMLLAVKQ